MDAKQIGIALVAIGAAVIIFGAIAARQGGGETTMRETHVLQGTTTAAGDYKYEEDAPYYRITALYPAKTPLQADADRKARRAIEQSLADRIAEFKQNGNFDSLTQEDIDIQGLGEDRKYALGMEYKETQGSGYVSYVYTIYEDTLGAHPNAYYSTLTFDKEGSEIALADLFKEGSEYLSRISAEVRAQIHTELSRRLSADPGDSFFEEGVAPNDENFRNFHLEGDSLAFLFPPYQVAAYAAGAFQARIPLSTLSDIRR